MRVEVHWLEPTGCGGWKHSEARYEFNNGVQLGSEIFYLITRGCVVSLMIEDQPRNDHSLCIRTK
jgi:hypothetical protein